MNTLPSSDEHDALAESAEQPPVSRTMKLVMAGCIALGVLDAYDDYRFFSAESDTHVIKSAEHSSQ